MPNKYESAFGPVVEDHPESEIQQKNYEIIGGNEAESLADSMREYQSPFGVRIYAATDKGRNYKNRNEDRVLVIPEKEYVAVIDGIGGYSRGDRAAELLAEGLASNDGIARGAELGKQKMQDEMLGNAGACFIAAVLEREDNKIYLAVGQSGDCKCIAFDAEGNILFESKDQSLVNELLEKGEITPDEALYHPKRNVVQGGVTPFDAVMYKTYGEEVILNKGDVVLLMSDGISDNLTPEELGEIIKDKQGSEIISEVSHITDERMANADKIIADSDREKDGKYLDGYKSAPKADNRSFVVMEIN